MEERSGNDETGSVYESRRGFRDLRTMCVTVKRCKETYKSHTRNQREPHRSGYKDPKSKHGDNNPHFDKGNVNTDHTQETSESHDANKSQRNCPDRAPTHLGRP